MQLDDALILVCTVLHNIMQCSICLKDRNNKSRNLAVSTQVFRRVLLTKASPSVCTTITTMQTHNARSRDGYIACMCLLWGLAIWLVTNKYCAKVVDWL